MRAVIEGLASRDKESVVFVPAGFATIAPYLTVRDAPGFIEFIVAGLGGVHLGSSLRDDGVVANGQVRFGDGDHAATVMVSEALPGFPQQPGSLYLFVADADAAMAQAVAHGARSIMAVGDRDYGDRQGGVTDAWGMTWWLSQRLTAEPYSFD